MYPHQTDRLTEALERERLAALVATAPANVLYVTGFASALHAAFGTPQFAVFTPAGAALVVPEADAPAVVAEHVAVQHVASYGPASPHATGAPGAPVKALAEALAALGVASGRVGLDESGTTAPAWQSVIEGLPGLAIVPAADAFGMARRVKGPWELECLQRALGIVEESLNTVLQTLEPGTTEQAALAAYEAEVVRRGGRPSASVVVAGPRTGIPYPLPSERPLRARDLVRFDAGGLFRGYCGRVARTGVVGEPDESQQRRHDALQAGVEAAVATIRPGAAVSAVHRAVIDAVRAAGLPAYARDSVGHGIGLTPAETPSIGPDVHTTLEMGEILQVAVPWFEPGASGLALSETILVTRLGSHVLNRSVRGLIALD